MNRLEGRLESRVDGLLNAMMGATVLRAAFLEGRPADRLGNVFAALKTVMEAISQDVLKAVMKSVLRCLGRLFFKLS